MASVNIAGPVIFIVGPTASGKTDLAIRIARQVSGEIICADSRTIYRDMNIGTAKPSVEDRGGVTHFGLDLVRPGTRYTAAQFQQYAYDTIAEIHARKSVAIVVGGTGLYVDSLLFNYEFGEDRDDSEREKISTKSTEELYKYCVAHNIELPQNVKNKRHLVRAIEQKGINHKRNATIPDNFIVAGISADKQVLQKRIEARVHTMFAQGVVDEAMILAKDYGWNSEAMTANIYQIIREMLDGTIDLNEAKSLAVRSDMRLAKRQMTWFKRNPCIHWSDDTNEIEKMCLDFIRECCD